MSSRRRLQKAVSKLDSRKEDRQSLIPGILGAYINGKAVQVAGRDGFHYVRLLNNTSEIIQAYNTETSPVFGLPVLIGRTSNKSRYEVIKRDVDKYTNWGSTPYSPRHGNQHSFVIGGGGDVSWIYDRQFMPLLANPSGSSGAENVIVQPSTYYWQGEWRYAGNTGTPNIVTHKPTNNQAKIVLVYIDDNDNPVLSTGGVLFAATITGSAEIIPFIPDLAPTIGLPVAGVRLVSGTTVVLWDNLYDVRPLITGNFSTGSSAATFTGLTDTPASYVGEAGNLAFVKGAEDGLEFITGAFVSNFVDLIDTPASYSGEGGQYVAVKGDETGLEFVSGTAGGGGGGGISVLSHFRATNLATLNPGSQTYTKIPFNVEEYDDGGDYESTGTFRWTPPEGDVTVVLFVQWWNPNNNGHWTFIYKNGVEVARYGIGTGYSFGVTSCITFHDQANGTDYYEAYAYKWDGGSYINTGSSRSYFSGMCLG